MTSAPLPPVPPVFERAFAPVAGAERLQALDVLRGFALVGICVANVEFFNRSVVETGQGIPAGLHGVDWLAAFVVNYAVSTKFWTMFSLLFGMGFALMQERAHAAGRRFVPTYLRRIGALLVFGLLHYCLLWNGDILISYAFGALLLVLTLFAGTAMLVAAAIVLLGVAQLPMLSAAAWPVAALIPAALLSLYLGPRPQTTLLQLFTSVPGALMLVVALIKGSDDALPLLGPIGAVLLVLGALVRAFPGPVSARPLRAGITLIVLIYGLVVAEGGARYFLSPPPPDTATATSQQHAGDQDDDGASYRRDLARSAEENRVLSEGDYAQAVAMRTKQLSIRLNEKWAGAIVLLSVFLTGIGLQRSGIIAQPAAHRPVLQRLALIGIPVGLGLGLLGALISTGRPPGIDDQGHDAATGLLLLGSLPASLGYMAAVLLMLHSRGALDQVRLLAPFGQMALTNYLSQSLVMTLLFYAHGLGLWGMGRALQLGIALALCALQIGLSHWWLARYSYGPVEWLWRALTYRTLPAFRR